MFNMPPTGLSSSLYQAQQVIYMLITNVKKTESFLIATVILKRWAFMINMQIIFHESPIFQSQSPQ